MLYGHESISTYTRSNFAIWMLMAFQAGTLNIGGFMACHRFVSHVTGFATYFGYNVNQSNYIEAWGMLLVPLFFLFGAMLSGQLVDLRLKMHKKPKYYISFGVIFFIILFVYFAGSFGVFGPFGESLNLYRDYVLLASLCLACGIQNGTITSVSKSVVRTTHLTGITTDLGIGIIRYFNRHRLTEKNPDEGKANLMRIGIIFFFGMGSVVGAFIYQKSGYSGFILPTCTSGILFIATVYFHKYRNQSSVASVSKNQ